MKKFIVFLLIPVICLLSVGISNSLYLYTGLNRVFAYEAPVSTRPADGTIAAGNSAIFSYGNTGRFADSGALITKDKVIKTVLQSDLERHRQDGWNILYYSRNMNALGKEIQNYLNNKVGKYGIYIKNLNTGQELIMNDGVYSAASIIKLFVMTGIYNEIACGDVEKTPELENTIANMITISDNLSSNQLVKAMGHGNYQTGFHFENAMSKSMGCVNTEHLSLFADCGDYVSYGNNAVSPYDCGIVLENIYRGTLISPQVSAEMLNLLKNQQRNNKIPQLLPEGTVCAHKTGESSSVQSDVGIVYSPKADYIICILTNNTKDGITDIQNLSRMVYDYFNGMQ